jgi:4-hydroxy-tetrahydrodipicolinate synthase
MSGPMFSGSITALITPFTNGRVDEEAFRKLVDWQIKQGTHALVSCGTTGESPTLSHDEDMRVTAICVEVADGRYYNKPTQDGLYAHFKAIHDAVEIPIIIYNIPGRCIVDMSVETMARLAELPNIIGVKDATADLKRPALTRGAIDEDFCQLSGEDATIVPFLAQGGHGCISVTANVAPALCANLHNAWKIGPLRKPGASAAGDGQGVDGRARARRHGARWLAELGPSFHRHGSGRQGPGRPKP